MSTNGERATHSRRKFYGWGLEDQGLSADEVQEHRKRLETRFETSLEATPAPRADEIELAPPRLTPPHSLSSLVSADHHERLVHTYGKSLPDSVRAFRRDFVKAPDLVAYPETEEHVAAILDWVDDTGAAAIPFGGGSSVVGGVEADVGDAYRGAVSIDLARLDQVLEIDHDSRAARIQAGIFGPALEARLRPHNLTLRHFPQSFEQSTLGGWIATRSGGHYASLYTHIDDFVESVRAVTPAGIWESRRLPGSGAGPSPDRWLIGSEGSLGIITEAWMRLQDRPTHRASAAVLFDDFLAGARAVRALAQSKLFPTNCRLIDANEAAGAAGGDQSLLVLGFEGKDHPVDELMRYAEELARDHGGSVQKPEGDDPQRSGAAGQWRNSFIRAPYYREHTTPLGVISDTFETAIPWSAFESFHSHVTNGTLDAIRSITGRDGSITCRFTHVYPDGPAPYFSFQALSTMDSMLDHWAQIKQAANEIVVDGGGTVTHHHAVGRDHRSGYDHQRPSLFARALSAAKRELDPNGILNPGVLIDPLRPSQWEDSELNRIRSISS